MQGYPVEETCFLLEGRLAIIDDETGEEQRFKPGDGFVVSKGPNTTWVIYERVKKFFMVVE